MKLNSRRTILTGLAFLSICAFWQMYDNVVPLILTKTFHMNETFSGAIMAADNVLALFLLPFFGGALGHRRTTKMRRAHALHSLWHCGCAVILMNSAAAAWTTATPPRLPASRRQALSSVLGLLLVAMGTYRSAGGGPDAGSSRRSLCARAANAIINLMGAVGGILYLAVAAVLYSQKRLDAMGLTKADRLDYQPLFLIVSAIMFVSVGILFLTIKEPRLAKEQPAAGGAAPGVEPCRDRRYRSRGPSEARPAQPQVSSCIDCPVVHGL